MGFLKDIESPYDINDYVRSYLGNGQDAREFAKNFVERRSKWRNAQKKAVAEDDMCKPAHAVNPNDYDFMEVKVQSLIIKFPLKFVLFSDAFFWLYSFFCVCFRESLRRLRRSQCRRLTAASWASVWQQRLTGSTSVTVTTESSDSKDLLPLTKSNKKHHLYIPTFLTSLSNTIKKNQTSAVLLLKVESQQYHVNLCFFVTRSKIFTSMLYIL